MTRVPFSGVIGRPMDRRRRGPAQGVRDLTLEVPASADHESWNIAGPDHIRLVSMPGGEVATWGVTDRG